VHRGVNRANRLARRVLAVHARHRHEVDAFGMIRIEALEVSIERIQCISRLRTTSCLPTTGMLFSDWQATVHALQPMQLFRSIAMPHA
jgi:hypothetical protein